MAKLIVNKFFANHSEIANAFDKNPDNYLGEIIVCNNAEKPGLYIKDTTGKEIGLHAINVKENDPIIKNENGELSTELSIEWNSIAQQIELYGKDRTRISYMPVNGIVELGSKLTSVEDVIFVEGDSLPEGVTEYGSYLKFTITTNEVNTYLYANLPESLTLTSGNGVDIKKNGSNYTISHSENSLETSESEVVFGETEIVTDVETNEFGHVTKMIKGKLPTPAVTDVVYEGESYLENSILNLSPFALKSEIPSFEESDVKVEGGDAESGKYINSIVSNGHIITVTKEILPTADISSEVKDNSLVLSVGSNKNATIEGGNNVSFVKNDENVVISTPDVEVAGDGTEGFVSNLETNGHGIKVTKSYLPTLKINDKIYDGSESVEITIEPADGNTTYTLSEDFAKDGKKFSVKLIGNDSTESTSILDLTDYVVNSEIIISDETVELGYGEEVELMKVKDKILTIKMPNEPTEPEYTLSNSSVEDKVVKVNLLKDNEVLSTATLDLSDFALSNEIVIVEDGSSDLAWGASTTIAKVGDVNVDVKLPSSPGYALSETIRNEKKYILNLKDANGNIISATEFDLSDFAYTAVLPDIKEGASELEWGKETVLATIDGVEIAAKLPTEPKQYRLEGIDVSNEKFSVILKTEKGTIIDSVSFNVSDYATKQYVDDVISGITTPNIEVEEDANTTGTFVTDITSNGHKLVLKKGDAELNKYVAKEEVENYSTTLEWGKATNIANIGGKEISVSLPDIGEGGEIEITPITYMLSNSVNGEKVRLVMMSDDGNHSTETTIDLSRFAKDTDLEEPSKHYDTLSNDAQTTDYRIKDTNVVLDNGGKVITNIIHDINGHITEIVTSKLPSSASTADSAKSASMLDSGSVGRSNTIVYFEDGKPVEGDTIVTATTSEFGLTKLTNTIDNTETLAVTPKALNNVKIFAESVNEKVENINKSLPDKWEAVTATIDEAGITKLVTGDLKDKTYANGEAAAASHTHSNYANKAHAHGKITLKGGVSGEAELTNTGAEINVTVNSSEHEHGNYAVTNHASSDTTYGVGTETNYGHVKLVKGELSGITRYTDGEAASSYHQHDGRYYTEAEINGFLKDKADTGHVHDASGITTGTINIARIPTGTSNTTVALGNHTHALTLTGDCEGSATISNTGVTLNVTVKDSSHNHEVSDVKDFNTTVNSLIDSRMAQNDAMVYKGTISSSSSLPATHNAGWAYKVTTAGTYAGKKCEIGDLIICNTDGTSANDSHWDVIQTNIDGAVTGPASATDGNIAVFDGTTGKLIKDSGFARKDLAEKEHVHDASGITAGTINIARIPTGTSNTTVALGNHTHNYADKAHEHGILKVTGDASGSAAISNTGVTIDLTVADDSHAHNNSYYTKDEVDTKLNGKANSTHTHGKVTLTGGASGEANFTNSGCSITVEVDGGKHTHVSSAITDSISNKSGITNTATGLVQGKAVYEYAQPKGNYQVAGSYAALNHAHGTLKVTGGASGSATIESGGTNIELTVHGSGHTHSDYAVTSHASTSTTYGVGSEGNYGHVKLVKGDLTSVTSYNNGVAAAANHNHDSKYYTETEIDAFLKDKSNTGHTHGTLIITGGASGSATIESGGTNLALTVHGSGHTHSNYLTSNALEVYATTKWVSDNYVTKDNVGSSHNHDDRYLCTTGGTVSGNLNITGTVSGSAFYETSDETLKDFVSDIELDFNKLKAIPKKYFTWKSDETKKVELGTSAQRVKDIYPEIIGESEDGTLSVDYGKLSIVALKAVDILYDENQEIKKEISELKTTLDLIKEKLGL